MSDEQRWADAEVYFSTVPEWIVDAEQGGLSANAVRLYALLDRYGNSAGAVKRPGRASLARRLGVSVDTVDRAKDELVKAGALTIEHRPNQTNVYHLHRSPAGSRTHAAPPDAPGVDGGGRTDAGTRTEAVTGGRTDAARQTAITDVTGIASQSPSADESLQGSLLPDDVDVDLDPAKVAARFLRAELVARGVTTIPRDYNLKAPAVARALLRDGLTADDLHDLIRWCLDHPWWGTRVTRMEKVRDLAPQWQQERNGTGPRAGVGEQGLSAADLGALANEWAEMGL